jgi:hypothetical protein
LRKSVFLPVFLLILTIFSWPIVNGNGQAETKIYVDPMRSTASPGNRFTIDVRIANVKGLWAYEFKLKWDPALLNAISATEGPFLSAEKTHKTFFFKTIYNEPDPLGESGYVYVSCTLMGEPATAAASGSGILATIEFLVKEEGQTSLNLSSTVLLDAAPSPKDIPHITDGGVFQYPMPEISIDPPSIVDPSLSSGETFNVSIVIAQTRKLYTWSLKMSWDPTLLNVTNIEEGSFLNRGGDYSTTFIDQIHREEGYLYANCSLIGEPDVVSASGNGTLFTVTFLIEAGGITALQLYDIRLLNYKGAELIFEAKNGYFSNAFRDVAIISVEASPNKVKAGDSLSITITIENKGMLNESFDVVVYYNDTYLGTLHISDLSIDAEKALAFKWNTKNVAEGEYEIKAVTSPMVGETNIGDNVFVYRYVTVTPPEQSFQLTGTTAAIIVVITMVTIAVVIVLRKRR